MCRELTAVGSVSGVAVAVAATGIAVGTASAETVSVAQASADIGVAVQSGGTSPALLDYFTFIPQALLLLIAVGLRRYVLDDADVPWWLDGDALRARAGRLVPTLRRSRKSGDNDQTDGSAGTTADIGSDGSADGSAQSESADASPTSGSTQSGGRDTSGGRGTSTGSASEPSADETSTPSSNHPGRTIGPVPDRLALSYRNQRVVVGDGDTVDEKIRAMLRAAGEGDHAKWIDDRHLHFIRDEHGFTLVVHGENPTRLNGDRMRPGDRARVYPGDEIDLSGVVTLAIERASRRR